MIFTVYSSKYDKKHRHAGTEFMGVRGTCHPNLWTGVDI